MPYIDHQEMCIRDSLYYNKFIFTLFDSLLKIAKLQSIVCILPSGSNRNADGSITGIALSNNCITVSGIDTTSSTIRSYEYSSCGAIKKDTKPNFCAACVDVVLSIIHSLLAIVLNVVENIYGNILSI